jgi:predicted metalloprotease with PDZ domain
VRKQTWRIDTRGISRITVEFDYRAVVFAANQARIAPDYAFFTGTQLFLLPEGHRSRPSVVRFDVPSGWRIASGLDDTADPMVFTASDYDTLVDQPTLMGAVRRDPVRDRRQAARLRRQPRGRVLGGEDPHVDRPPFTKLAETQGRIFGGLPYRKFVYFYFFRPAEARATVLEQQNSYVALMNAGARAQPDDLVAQASHEFFQVWNVKRIRPAQMWPYDYARENETPLLWVSEGFTNYYSSLAAYRAGFKDARSFVDEVARTIAELEGNEAHRYISASDSPLRA